MKRYFRCSSHDKEKKKEIKNSSSQLWRGGGWSGVELGEAVCGVGVV